MHISVRAQKRVGLPVYKTPMLGTHHSEQVMAEAVAVLDNSPLYRSMAQMVVTGEMKLEENR